MALSNKAKAYIKKNYRKKSVIKLAENLNANQEEVRRFVDEISEPLPARKKALFYIITLSIPIIFFLSLEGVLRGVNYLGDTSLFIDPKVSTGSYFIPNPNFAARYFFYTNTIPNPSIDAFKQDKPENGYRVFAMGGSSAAGYPYSFNGTFSRVVDDILTDAMPEKEVEVVNLGISAVNSYTMYDQVDEIIEQQPDAIMIYAGHNEFYGALGVGSNENLGGFPGFVRFYLKLQRFKTFLFLRDLIVDTGKWLAGFTGNSEDRSDPSDTLMERIVKSRSITLDGSTYELALIQFRSNMEAILKKYKEHDIPVYLSTISSNVKDQPPFVSIEHNEHPPAAEVYSKAVQLLQSGDTLAARKEFVYAKDLDGLKFRAPSEINNIIRELAASHDHVHLVEAQKELRNYSKEQIVGNNLMLEHLHPNQQGYFLIGRSFAQTMGEKLSGAGMADTTGIEWNSYKDKMYLSELDERIVWHRVQTLKQGFPFVQDGSKRRYQENYRAQGFIDSLAFLNVHSDEAWDRSKVKIAKRFEEQGKTEQAIYEYLGLIRNQPWNDSPYTFAARIYLDQGNFSKARPLLEKANHLNPESAFITKMLGAIELNGGNVKRAIQLLEKSYQLNPNDTQMLFNLSGAYGTNREFQKALEIARKVADINPGFPGLNNWLNQLQNIINSRNNN